MAKKLFLGALAIFLGVLSYASIAYFGAVGLVLGLLFGATALVFVVLLALEILE